MNIYGSGRKNTKMPLQIKKKNHTTTSTEGLLCLETLLSVFYRFFYSSSKLEVHSEKSSLEVH